MLPLPSGASFPLHSSYLQEGAGAPRHRQEKKLPGRREQVLSKASGLHLWGANTPRAWPLLFLGPFHFSGG